MAVEVITGFHGGVPGNAQIVEEYESGASITVDDGHLSVRAVQTGIGAGTTVAVFAPGKWMFARVVDAS